MTSLSGRLNGIKWTITGLVMLFFCHFDGNAMKSEKTNTDKYGGYSGQAQVNGLPLFFKTGNTNKITIVQSFSGYGLRYRSIYVGAHTGLTSGTAQFLSAQLDIHTSREKIRFSPSGVRVGSLLGKRMLVYVKAGFMDRGKWRPLGENLFPNSQAFKTNLNTGIGLEWHIPGRLSISGEVSAFVKRKDTKTHSDQRKNRSFLFTLRYIPGKN